MEALYPRLYITCIFGAENINMMERSIIFILLSMLLSCTGNKAYDQQLNKADSIMDIADDSAQIAIKCWML